MLTIGPARIKVFWKFSLYPLGKPNLIFTGQAMLWERLWQIFKFPTIFASLIFLQKILYFTQVYRIPGNKTRDHKISLARPVVWENTSYNAQSQLHSCVQRRARKVSCKVKKEQYWFIRVVQWKLQTTLQLLFKLLLNFLFQFPLWIINS